MGGEVFAVPPVQPEKAGQVVVSTLIVSVFASITAVTDQVR